MRLAKRIKNELNETEIGILRTALQNSVDIEDYYPKLYKKLYTFYVREGMMPYDIAKARTGDPYDWIVDKLWNDLYF